MERANVAATVNDGLRCSTCLKSSCSAPGQYAKGEKITDSCYTRDDTETNNGDKWVVGVRAENTARILGQGLGKDG